MGFVMIQIKSWLASDNRRNNLVLLFIGLNLAITIPLAALLNLGIDEGFSLNTTSKDIGYAIFHSIQFEGQPPFYFALLNLWRSLNSSIFFARLLSILAISLTIYTAAVLSQRYFKHLHPGWVAATVALHPYSIWAALEIRMYAIAILLSTLLLLFFFEGYLAETPKLRAKWLYLLCSVLGLYTNYLLACLLIGNALTLVIFKRWRALYSYILTMVGVGVLFLPMAFILFFHFTRFSGVLANYSVSFIESLRAVVGRVIDYVLPIKDLGKIPATFIDYLQLSWVLVLGLFVAKFHRFLTVYQAVLFSTALTSGIVLVSVLDLMNAITFSERYVYPLFTIAIFSLHSAFSVVPALRNKKNLIICLMVLLFVCLSSLVSIYKPLAKSGDWKRVAAYIQATEKPNQPILVFPELDSLPLSYHYSGINTLVPLPRAMGQEKFDLSTIVLKNEQEIIQALSKASANPQTFWLVSSFRYRKQAPEYWSQCTSMNFKLNCQVLEEFIHKYYSIEQTKEFYLSNVRLVRRKPL